MDMTAEYRALYLKHWPKLEELRRSHPKMSPPLLLSPPDEYASQATRIFCIGQETPDWYDDSFDPVGPIDLLSPDAIDELMRIYKDEPRRQTTFHQAIREVERTLGIAREAILWSNLNKAGESGRRPSPELADALLNRFPVLLREVAIGKPHVVIFFTGPSYDERLTATFPGAFFERTALPERQLARVVHPGLPARSFRTYHPTYLRRTKKWRTILPILCALSRSN